MPDSRGTAAVEAELSLLLRTARSVSTALAGDVHPDLTGGEYLVLAAIADLGSARSADLVARLGLDKSTVSRLVASLRGLGLVEMTVDGADARARLLALTQDGATRFDRVRAARRARFRSYLQTWPQDDLDGLAGLLHRLNSDLLAR